MKNDEEKRLSANAAAARWRAKYPERFKANRRRSYRKHAEKRRAEHRQWTKDHPNEVKAHNDKITAKKRLRDTGFTHAEYVTCLEYQNYKCAICDVNLNTVKACADHHHGSGQKRGVLCSACNAAIGFMKENTTALRKAAEYIEFWRLFR